MDAIPFMDVLFTMMRAYEMRPLQMQYGQHGQSNIKKDAEINLELSGRSTVKIGERDRELGETYGLTSQYPSEIKHKELRLLLIGKTGHGKSATGNTILKRKEFQSAMLAKSITQECQFGEVEWYGRKLVVVDTPGLCDTTCPPEAIQTELIRSVGYASPGFHAIIFVLDAARFTEECIKVRDLYFDWFGKDVSKHTLILITRGEEIENREAYLQNVPKALEEFIESCGRRVTFFNNKASEPDSENQLKELIKTVDHIVDENKGRHFSNIAFRLAMAYERMSNTPLYQWMVKRFQANDTSEQTNRRTDQLQASYCAGRANRMSSGHYEVQASSSESIGSDESQFHKIMSALEEQMPFDETDGHTVTTHDTEPFYTDSDEVHASSSETIDESANRMRTGHYEVHASSSEGIESDEFLFHQLESVLEEQLTFEKTNDHTVTTHDTKPYYIDSDEVHASSSETIDESDDFLVDGMEPVLEEQLTFDVETDHHIVTTHVTNQYKKLANGRSTEGTKLRDQIKKPGVFGIFLRFIRRMLGKRMNKSKRVPLRKARRPLLIE